ncbi:MAG: aldo/keto reductase [Chloroflexi bacterium]|nr:aldo/keto reductase [Chloroflexota bacterium]MCI0846205.1 aldo/keto reductase [Chloroflexota bacterium]
MEYRMFGRTDITVSVLGFGCWEMGGTYGDIGETQVIAAVNRAIDLGINCFDTAPAYGRGQSERTLGKALGSRRKDVVVVTKCGVGYTDRPKGRDSRLVSIMSSVEQSLRDLQTDYLDVLLVHWPDVTTPFDETMHALDSIVQQGKVRAVGVSNFNLGQIKECAATRRIEVVQYGLNMFDRRMEQEMFPYFLEQGIGVMVYGPLAFGLLAGAFTEDTTFGQNDWRATGGRPGWNVGVFAEEHFQRNVRVVEALKPIAEQRGKKMPHLALRWVLSNPAVSVALVGTRTVEELEDNMAVLEWALSGNDMAEIDEIFARYAVDTHPDIVIDPEE